MRWIWRLGSLRSGFDSSVDLPSVLLNNFRHWLDRAEEARAVAGQMNDPEMKRIMLEIVVRYERLAHLSEARSRAPQPAAKPHP